MQNLKLEYDGKELILTCKDGTVKKGGSILLHYIGIADIQIIVDVKLVRVPSYSGPMSVRLDVYNSHTSCDGDAVEYGLPLDDLGTFPDLYQKYMVEVVESLTKRINDTQDALGIVRREFCGE